MFPGFEKLRMMDINAASKHLDLSRQALYIAINKNKLNHSICDGKIFVSERMLDQYQQNKYLRRLTLNLEDHQFTVKDVAKKLGCSTTVIYYLVRSGKMKSYRIKSAYIIIQEFIDEYLKDHPSTKTTQ